MKINKINVSVIIAVLLTVIFSCNKTALDTANIRSEEVFKRNPLLGNVFNEINQNFAKEDVLNLIINKYRELDVAENFSGKLKEKFGVPLWDISMALNGEKGTKALITSFEKEFNGKSLILISYMDSKGSVIFKLIDDKTEQIKLPVKVDADGKNLTRSTIIGFFNSMRKLKDIWGKEKQNQGDIRTNQVITTNNTVSWECWYSYGYNSNGDFWMTNTQCRYTLIIAPAMALSATDEIDGGGGWGGGQSNNDTKTNQEIIDSLQGYPCAQAVLAQMPDCNEELARILGSVFGVSSETNIKFKVNPFLPDTVVAETFSESGALSNYWAVVEMNPKFLSGSQDYIAATMIHEALHAYIKYQRTLLGTDTTKFKKLFPIYWEFRGDEAQHNEMAGNYIGMMTRFLKNINTNLPSDVAAALAWGGLEKTAIYKAKSQASKDSIQNYNYRANNPTSKTVDSLKIKKCL